MEGSDLHLVQAAPAWQCLADSLCQLVRCLVCKGDGRNLRRFYAPLTHKVLMRDTRVLFCLYPDRL